MKFQHCFSVRAPLARVAEFHARPASMAAITPPPMVVRMHRAPEHMGSSDEMEFPLGPVRRPNRPRWWRLRSHCWLQFEALPHGDGQTLLTQTAYLAPKGISGPAYWYGLYPFHGAIFGNMARAIGERAEGLVLARPATGVPGRLWEPSA